MTNNIHEKFCLVCNHYDCAKCKSRNDKLPTKWQFDVENRYYNSEINIVNYKSIFDVCKYNEYKSDRVKIIISQIPLNVLYIFKLVSEVYPALLKFEETHSLNQVINSYQDFKHTFKIIFSDEILHWYNKKIVNNQSIVVVDDKKERCWLRVINEFHYAYEDNEFFYTSAQRLDYEKKQAEQRKRNKEADERERNWDNPNNNNEDFEFIPYWD